MQGAQATARQRRRILTRSREPKVSPGLASQKETEEERKQQEERLTLSENRIRETKDLRSTMQ
ncbi:hypothetical protein KAM645c_56790 (plasmid) [Klebsiella quasipneumoniae subsp. quasipneumoniae]|nr:hypothetical protein KAM645c_56790 [Klebsiella quasipneumoniae subsp. quasipneumoniae]